MTLLEEIVAKLIVESAVVDSLSLAEQRPHFGVYIWELEPYHCRWIEDPTNGLYTLYCGCPRQRGSSYCPAHTRRAYR